MAYKEIAQNFPLSRFSFGLALEAAHFDAVILFPIKCVREVTAAVFDAILRLGSALAPLTIHDSPGKRCRT